MLRINRTAIIFLLSISVTTFAANSAPDFTLERIEGGKFVLREALKNGPVLIDFWATWCKPCLRALTEIQQFWETYSDSGLQVVTISTDNPKSRSKVKPFIRGKKYKFEVLYDTDQEVRKLFGGSVIPFTALIDTSGVIVYQHIGYKPGDEKKVDAVIRRVLGLDPLENALQEEGRTN